jgi:hypothetical protein
MGWNAGALGAMMGFGGALQQVGMQQLAAYNKKNEMQQENDLLERRELMLQHLKPPEVKDTPIEDPDNPGQMVVQHRQWQPPSDPGGEGQWVDMGTSPMTPKYRKDTVEYTAPDGTPMVKGIMYDENSGKTMNVPGSGAPKFDPGLERYRQQELAVRGGEAAETARYHSGELKNAQDRLAFEQANGRGSSSRPGTYDFGDDLQGTGTIDPTTNTFVPALLPSGMPMISHRNRQNIAVDDQGNPIPLSQDDYAKLGPTKGARSTGAPLLSAASGGDDSGGPSPYPFAQLSPQPKASAQQALADAGKNTPASPVVGSGAAGNSPHGAIVRTGTRNGVRVAQYADGTIAPI